MTTAANDSSGFAGLGLAPAVLSALADVGYEAPSPIQAATIPVILAGHDLLGQLSPTSVADQFEQGRARTIAPGQDPRPKYWEHYAEFYRVITQNQSDGLPRAFTEAFERAYAATRDELRSRRREAN